MTRLASSLALAVGALLALPAAAQFAKPEDAIKYRQSAFFVLGQHFGRLGAMANGRAPYNAAAAAVDAEVAAGASKLPWAAFGPGTEGGKAKPEIWKEQAKYKELAEKSMTELGKLQAAAKAGNLDALKAQFEPTGKTCKACHDDFRNK